MKAFDKGELKDVWLHGTETDQSPPPGHLWLLLSGTINHITATATTLSIQKPVGEHILAALVEIPSGIASFTTPLWNVAVQTAGTQSQWVPTIMDHSETLRLLGDANADAHVKVLEWMP